MEFVRCPDLCPGCPVQKMLDGEPAVIGQIGYTLPGGLELSQGANAASLELANGRPADYDLRTADIAVANKDYRPGVTFRVPGKSWDDGTVVRSFEACRRPTRPGIFRKLACTAIENLKRL